MKAVKFFNVSWGEWFKTSTAGKWQKKTSATTGEYSVSAVKHEKIFNLSDTVYVE